MTSQVIIIFIFENFLYISLIRHEDRQTTYKKQKYSNAEEAKQLQLKQVATLTRHIYMFIKSIKVYEYIYS